MQILSSKRVTLLKSTLQTEIEAFPNHVVACVRIERASDKATDEPVYDCDFVRLSVCPFVRLSVCPFVPGRGGGGVAVGGRGVGAATGWGD